MINNENFYISNKIFAPGVYYWRTCPTNSLIWSETRKFTIDYNWVRKKDIPEYLNSGGSIAYHRYQRAESIYCLIGGGRRNFYCYSVNKDTWFKRCTTELRQRGGSSLVSCYNSYVNVYDRELFAVFGEYTNKSHYKYKISHDRWYAKDTIWETLGEGACLAFDTINADLYLVTGGGSRRFYYNPYPRYDEEEENSTTQSKDFIKIRSEKFLFNKDNILISYHLDIPYYLEISVYNFCGEKIKTLIRDRLEKGRHQIYWDKRDEKGKMVSSGIYFIVIKNEEGRRKSVKVAIR